MKTMKITQGVLKAPKVVFSFRTIGFKGLPTLGVGSMQSFFYLVVSASQKLNVSISMDRFDWHFFKCSLMCWYQHVNVKRAFLKFTYIQ